MKELERLRGAIITNSLKKVAVTNESELLRINGDGVFMIVYKSGTIVYENNPETMKVIDQVFINQTKYDYELGSDEVGKGEWFGPLVVVCVALTPSEKGELRKTGVKDSKKLSIGEIKRLASDIREKKILWRPLILRPPIYNTKVEEFKKENKNLNDLLAWAHSAVIKDTLDKLTFNSVQVVIDRFDVEKTYRRLYGIDEKKVRIIQMTRGESEIPVAVASVLAKDIFEKEVDTLCKSFGMDFRGIDPSELPKPILEQVAKLHFKNITK